MRLSQIIEETLELLIANYENPRFKSFGDLKKHEYQMSKSAEDRENRSMMYEGKIGDPEAARKGHRNRKNKEEINKRAAKTRANWYKSEENRKKFMEALKKRKKRAIPSKQTSDQK